MAEDREALHKHLDFIQLTITRMAANSFLLKGWTVTLVAAILAFVSKDGKPMAGLIGLVPAIVFWILDAFYLKQERAYRDLYNEVRQKDPVQVDYDLDATRFSFKKGKLWDSVKSDTLKWFYVPIILVIFLVALLGPLIQSGNSTWQEKSSSPSTINVISTAPTSSGTLGSSKGPRQRASSTAPSGNPANQRTRSTSKQKSGQH